MLCLWVAGDILGQFLPQVQEETSSTLHKPTPELDPAMSEEKDRRDARLHCKNFACGPEA